MKALETAFSYLGISEIKGSLHNKDIIQMFADIGHHWVKDDETAWCAAFVGSCLEKAGIRSTRKLNARSYLEFGTETKTPKLGDIVIFWRGSKTSWQGHVGFYLNEHKGYIYTLGGNQSDSVCVQKYPKERLLGIRTYSRGETKGEGYISKKEYNEKINSIIRIIKYLAY